MTTLRKKIYIEGILTDPDTVVLSDVTGTYGIRDQDENIVISADKAMVKESTGVYYTQFGDTLFNRIYTYSIKYTISGVDYYLTGTLYGPTQLSITIGPMYVNEQEMIDFFNTRVNSAFFDAATSDERITAAKQATDIIDRLNFDYDKTSSTQELQFPRNSETTVPQAIKDACCLIALELLAGTETNIEFDNLRLLSNTYSKVSSKFDGSNIPDHTTFGIPSREAWILLWPYMKQGRSLKLYRV
jgi:hypothetical protein